jgi:hypothetical protein
MLSNVMQFKLTNGEEIICQVVEWPEDDDTDYIVHNALLLMQQIVNGTTKYMFKPWFTMAEKSDQYISISKEQIVACVYPNEVLNVEFINAKREMYYRSGYEQIKSKSLPSAMNDTFNYNEKEERRKYEEMQKEILSLIDEIEKSNALDEMYNDSDSPSNVIKFPGPDSIH